MPQFGLRDNLIRCELLKNEDLYTYLEDFRYFTVCKIQLLVVSAFKFTCSWQMVAGTFTYN